MNGNIIISKRVIDTINALPFNEKKAITKALACELILGEDAAAELTPIQSMLYSIIKYYVRKDMGSNYGRMRNTSDVPLALSL